MAIKQPILWALTILVSVLISTQLLSSWVEPQAQSQLNLYQSDLLLHASEWGGLDDVVQGSPTLRNSLMGDNPIQEALKNYQSVRTSAQKDLDRLSRKSSRSQAKPSANPGTVPTPKLEAESSATAPSLGGQSASARLIDELDLRLGLLYIQSKNQEKALQTWTRLIDAHSDQPTLSKQVQTAQALKEFWSESPQILPNAEPLLTNNLSGWFRFQGLSRLYTLQQRQGSLQTLEQAEQEKAFSAFVRLLIVGAAPALGSAVGFAVLMGWVLWTLIQWRKNKSQPSVESISTVSNSADSFSSTTVWVTAPSREALTPKTERGVVLWPPEIVWQVMVLWFTAFFGVSFILPVVLLVLGLHPEKFDGRMQGYFALFSYVCLMAVGLGILQFSLRQFVPNVLQWLRVRWSGNWFFWGLGSYFVALPIVLIVSLLNQKILHDQGGGNPILEIILQSHDGFTIGLLWFLVAVCAPLFEESLFRGFFLTSLTRYLPTGVALVFSAGLFALAHLNLGDLLPLTVLGMILGFVYLRSQNLLASILLHSLWNSGSFLGLLILGSSNS